MRFSPRQQPPPFDAERERARRRAKFVGGIKAEIRQAANARGMTLADLSRVLKVNKSVISRALDPAQNVELFTLFDFAEALGKEWHVYLRDHAADLTMILDNTPRAGPVQILMSGAQNATSANIHTATTTTAAPLLTSVMTMPRADQSG